MAIVEVGDPSSGDGSVSVGNGALQVYGLQDSSGVSGILGAILGRQVHVIAGDWRGVQYWIDPSHKGSADSAVWMFDPSSMATDVTVDLRTFTNSLPSQSMLNAVDAGAFNEWCRTHGAASIGQAECVPIIPPNFISGSASIGERAGRSVSVITYLIYCAKAVRVMKDLGLRSGDVFPSNFDDLVSAI